MERGRAQRGIRTGRGARPTSRGLLLLTATPEQLGPESHFARLRLLDPDRYSDFAAYQAESDHYADIAPIAGALHAGNP